MHGIVFTSFQDYLRSCHGGAIARDVFDGAIYAMSDVYDDADLARLLARASERLAIAQDELVRDFGRYTGKNVFPRLYPAFYAISAGTLPFLLTIENRIHELVRATIVNARPPELKVIPEADGVQIHYTSPRRLCRLLEGLVHGTGEHYEEPVEIREIACVSRGDLACLFHVTVPGAAVLRPRLS